MGNLRFVVLVFLFVGTTQINGKSPQTVVRTDIKGRLLTAEQGCGYSKVFHSRIVGGAPSKVGAWPWIAVLAYKIGWLTSFKCGGSLITSKHILSAAHCVLPSLSFARLGAHNLTTEEDGQHEDIKIARSDPHESYNRRLMTDDIAILHLERDVQFTDRISPICLPIHGEVRGFDYIGKSPFIAGWGYTEEKGKVSEVLQEVQVPVITNKECAQSYRDIKQYFDKMQFSEKKVLCAGYKEGGKDSCQGDSGGPLMLPIYSNGRFPFYQIGVISYGAGCAHAKIPGVYTNVKRYAHWIKKKLHEKIVESKDDDEAEQLPIEISSFE